MKIEIHQIYYRPEQKRLLDSDYIPYDNLRNPKPEWAETFLFFQEYPRIRFEGPNHHIGFVSWKFNRKTKTSGRQFINEILQNPGYDTYFINPFPRETYYFDNVWDQCESCTPGILNLAQNLFSQMGYDINLEKLRFTPENATFCNYWVGNESFWKKYYAFCFPFYTYIESHQKDPLIASFFRRANKKIETSFLPFLMERLFSTLLVLDKSIRYLRCQNQNSFYYPLLRGMKPLIVLSRKMIW